MSLNTGTLKILLNHRDYISISKGISGIFNLTFFVL